MSSGLRKRARARTKQAIYSAAMRLFAAKGFNETTVDESADAAEVSRATFFNNFGTKDGVLRHYSEMLAEELSQAFEETKSEPSSLNRMRHFLMCWLNQIAKDREEARRQTVTGKSFLVI